MRGMWQPRTRAARLTLHTVVRSRVPSDKLPLPCHPIAVHFPDEKLYGLCCSARAWPPLVHFT
eukprot:3004386-Prymnesium_polylepis.2